MLSLFALLTTFLWCVIGTVAALEILPQLITRRQRAITTLVCGPIVWLIALIDL